jgi:hypothetical protein
MKRSCLMRPLALVTFCAFGGAALAASADTPPLRHLVYAFSYQSRQHGLKTNDPGEGSGRGYGGNLDDKGTITVDVLREAKDRGLVVVVSEQADYVRSATPATCAVYGNTTVICGQNAPVNSEEYTLLRFLGANFVDPSHIDDKQQWSIAQSSGSRSVSADYTIKTNHDGVMTIEETRRIEDTSVGATTTNVETKLDYNFNRLLPTSIDEYTIEQQNIGVKANAETIYQTTLNLVSDSMAKQ